MALLGNGYRDTVQDFSRPRARASTNVSTNGFRPQGKRSKHGRTVSESEGSILPSEKAAASPKSVNQESGPGFLSPNKPLEESSDDQAEGEIMRDIAGNNTPTRNLNIETLQREYVHSRAPVQVTTNPKLPSRHHQNSNHSTTISLHTPKARIKLEEETVPDTATHLTN